MISGRKMLFLRGLFFVGLVIHFAIADTTPAGKTTSESAKAGEKTTPKPEGAQDADKATIAGKHEDYCDHSLCRIGYVHVACNASHELHERCSLDAELITITKRLQKYITRTFNELRDKVAKGGYNGLSPAARMGTIKWDPELAHLAEYNVQKCDLKTDDCVNTKTNSHVGQIIGYRGLKGNLPILEDILKDIMRTWLRTSSSSSMLDVLHNNNPIPRLPKYNFLQIVLEDVKHVGCGIVQQVHNGWFQTYFTCNFNIAPTVGAAIYETSFVPGSSCKTGPNKKYANLCSAAETYSKPAKARSRFTYLSSQQDLSLGAADTSPEQEISIDTKPSGGVATKHVKEDTSRDVATKLVKEDTFGDVAMALKQRSVIQRRDGGDKAAADGGTTPAAPAGNTTVAAGDDAEKSTQFDLVETPTPASVKIKEIILKKFDRFLKLMERAQQTREKRKIVVITSNHEVVDINNNQAEPNANDAVSEPNKAQGQEELKENNGVRSRARSFNQWLRSQKSYRSAKWNAINYV